jgi:hypothetical protein
MPDLLGCTPLMEAFGDLSGASALWCHVDS